MPENYSEKTVEKRLREETKKGGGWAIKMPAVFDRGLPDRLCLFPGGRVIFVETKSTGDKPSKIQLITFSKIRKLGFRVHVIDNVPDVLALVQEFRT